MTIDNALKEIIREEVSKALIQNLEELISRINQIRQSTSNIPDSRLEPVFSQPAATQKWLLEISKLRQSPTSVRLEAQC